MRAIAFKWLDVQPNRHRYECVCALYLLDLHYMFALYGMHQTCLNFCHCHTYAIVYCMLLAGAPFMHSKIILRQMQCVCV